MKYVETVCVCCGDLFESPANKQDAKRRCAWCRMRCLADASVCSRQLRFEQEKEAAR